MAKSCVRYLHFISEQDTFEHDVAWHINGDARVVGKVLYFILLTFILNVDFVIIVISLNGSMCHNIEVTAVMNLVS